MAGKSVLFFTIMTIITLNEARDCNNETSITNCDDCFRCGGIWCYDKQIPECKIGNEDNICSEKRESISTISQPDAEQLMVQKTSKKDLHFKSNQQLTPKLKISSSSQTNNVISEYDDVFCIDQMCEVTLEVTPKTDFCLNNGGSSEQFMLNVSYGAESQLLKYEVPCACGCSEHGTINASDCHRRGDLKCGVCLCHEGWQGRRCEREKCPHKIPQRGDIPDCTKDSDCYGNGECHCEQCRCNMQLDGARYFDNHCRDICSITRDMDVCITNVSKCNDLDLEPFNETKLYERDIDGSVLWIKCNITVDDCLIQYATLKERDLYRVMIIKDCEVEAAAVAGGVTLTVPVVLGVIAIVAAVAAAAGYMMLKNRPPPLPFTDPQYQDINADYCEGENPLYKCPTSSFKNPTYGKC